MSGEPSKVRELQTIILDLTAELDTVRQQRDDLRRKLQHLLIDPSPLAPAQLANLRKLIG